MKPTKTAAAVRAGLLATTAMLALAGSGISFAQTCTPAAPAAGGTTTCSGAFTDSVNNHFTDNTDITVVLDDTVTVDPASGFVGIDLSANGDITLDSSGVFTVYNADAIYVYGSTSATVGVYGDVYNYAADNTDSAVEAYSLGDVAVTIGAAVSTYGYNGTAYTVEAFSDTGDVTIDVQQYASVDATSYNGNALGVWAQANNAGDVTMTNAGDISATTTYGNYAWGTSLYAYNAASLTNSGSISATGYYNAYGAHLWAYDGDATVTNDGGTISASASNYSDDAYAVGVYAYSYNGSSSITNSGDISAYAYADNTLYDADATGAYAYGYLGASIDNSGTIDATISGYDGTAYGALAISYNDAAIHNTGSISANSIGYYGTAIGALAYGYNASVDNDGADASIAAYSYYGTAIGAVASAYYVAEVSNSGSISADVVYGYAYGAIAAGYDATISNADGGSISAYSYYGGAEGAYSIGYYSTITNAGDIDATVGYYGTAIGALAYGVYSDVSNSGSISASSYYGSAIGAAALGLASGYVYNDGDISASVGYYGTAIGAAAVSLGYAEINNTENGSISAYSYYGTAIGAYAYGSYAEVNNAGDIYGSTYIGSAYGAYANGIYGYVNNSGSIGAYSYYGFAAGAVSYGVAGGYVYNDGDIEANVYVGTAIGAVAISPNYAEVYNTENGSISGYAYYGTGIGVEVLSGDSAAVINAGDISGTGYIGAYNGYYYAGTGIGVLINVVNDAYVYNTGTITGDGGYYDGGDYAILSIGTSADYIVNQGTMNGSIDLGYGDDTLYNGVDGTINLGNYNFIDMGSFVTNPNVLENYGTINFVGSTAIYNYGGEFYNAGHLSSLDGSANDYMFIGSDLSGDGEFDLEVDGAAAPTPAADYVYIYGDVAADSNTLINVDLLSLPQSDSTVTPLVGVSGTSTGANFDLGDVHYEDNNFLDLQFSLIEDIDATNATPDVFSLGIEVVGLTDPGTLAASVVGADISLLTTTVGTWRERMGVIDSFRKNSVSLWARVFTSKGEFSPEHVATGFGNGGNFDWHQRNSGFEAGVDFAVTDSLSMGVLVGKSEADVDLIDGVGENEIDSDNYGVYATWVRDGWYVDGSYRWSDFENRLRSVGGNMSMDGDARIFNIEAGYAFVMASGLKIEPQAQYTSIKFDHFDVAQGDLANFTVEDASSSRGRLGLSFRQDFGDAETGWMWTPYATLSAVREFDGKGRYVITDDFYGYTSVEGTSAMLELGFNARHDNLAFYGGLTWQDGGPMDSFFGGHLGVRYTFGGAAPAPVVVAPPPAKTCADLDDDGDGVNNCDDRCPGSPAGSAVGADGCPVPAPEPEPVMEPKPYRG
jgi:outer membrane autotransporter protein